MTQTELVVNLTGRASFRNSAYSCLIDDFDCSLKHYPSMTVKNTVQNLDRNRFISFVWYGQMLTTLRSYRWGRVDYQKTPCLNGLFSYSFHTEERHSLQEDSVRTNSRTRLELCRAALKVISMRNSGKFLFTFFALRFSHYTAILQVFWPQQFV